jgi:sugar O-acyltransferase (sialic acid O-acetyltransferase NeuD family)
MIIVGAKGFAKEVLEILYQLTYRESEIAFFDNVNSDAPDHLFGKFPVIKNEGAVKEFFRTTDQAFTLGIGGPVNRTKLDQLFSSWGGELTSTISPKANVGHFGIHLERGINLMTGSVLTNDIIIGRGVLINLNCTIGHDSRIGNFAELSPGVNVSGNCNIGPCCNIGTNATLLPNVTLGENVIVGANALVTKDVPSNSLVVGVPGKVIKKLPPLMFDFNLDRN